jgi:hypothetical protein
MSFGEYMLRNHSLGTVWTSAIHTDKMKGVCLSVLAIICSFAFASFFLNIGQAQASGIIETPTKTNPWAITIDNQEILVSLPPNLILTKIYM